MISNLGVRLWQRYTRSALADYIPAFAVMCGGLWVTALLIGI